MKSKVLIAVVVLVASQSAFGGPINKYSCSYVEEKIERIQKKQRRSNSASAADYLNYRMRELKELQAECLDRGFSISH